MRFKRRQQCTPCYDREYREKNKDRFRAKKKEYQARHHAKNKDRLNAIGRANSKRRWKENPQQEVKKQREYLKRVEAEHPGKVAEWSARGSARRRSRMGESTPAELVLIRAIYKKCKEITSETGIAHEVDHHFPLAGCCPGKHHPDNLKIITRDENRRKNRSCPIHKRRRYVSTQRKNS